MSLFVLTKKVLFFSFVIPFFVNCSVECNYYGRLFMPCTVVPTYSIYVYQLIPRLFCIRNSIFVQLVTTTSQLLFSNSCLSLLRSLTLWWGADDVMLQILGEVCPALQQLDLWKSARVTDLGLRALLGLSCEADESPTGGIISETTKNFKEEAR
jgi:hypothetical protein